MVIINFVAAIMEYAPPPPQVSALIFVVAWVLTSNVCGHTKYNLL